MIEKKNHANFLNDSPQTKLQAPLLYNSNKYASIPLEQKIIMVGFRIVYD